MVVTSQEQLDEFAQVALAHKGPVVFDTETTGVHPYLGDQIIGYAFYFPLPNGRRGKSYYIPVRHVPHRITCSEWIRTETQPTARKKIFPEGVERFPDGIVHERVYTGDERFYDLNLDPVRVILLLDMALFSRPEVILIGWNIKFDLNMVKRESHCWQCKTYDSMIAAHNAEENHRSYELGFQGDIYVGGAKAEEELIEWGKTQRLTAKQVKGHLARAPLFAVGYYAEQDCILTADTHRALVKKLRSEQPDLFKGTDKTAYDIFLEFGGAYNEAIQRMEQHGVPVDCEVVREGINLCEVKIDELYQVMAKHAGQEFNPASPVQVSKLLGLPRSNKAYLAISEHPIAPVLGKYRQWSRALTTYYRPWLQLVDEQGTLHPTLWITTTVATRLSCRDPNMQNLPRQNPEIEAYDLRRAIVAPKGRLLVRADYSQIELRIATHYSKVPEWLEGYRRGGFDIHQQTAEMIGLIARFGPKVGRDSAKTVNFATLYGMGAEGLSSALTLAGVPTTIAEARDFLFKFRDGKPELVRWSRDVQAFAKRKRYIELWTGRRRHYPIVPFYEEDKSHTAVNNVIQGGAAELMRKAIQNLDALFENTREREGDAPMMHLAVHDEILFSMAPGTEGRWIPVIREIMTQRYLFDVPIEADFKIGQRWSAMEKVAA